MRGYCLILACCMLLTGCGSGGIAPEAQLASAKSIYARWNDVTMVMTVTETGCEFAFDTPETLQTLRLVFDGTVLTADCEGLVAEVSPLFAAGILPLYRGVLACKVPQWEDAGEGVRRISLDGTDFLVYYDPVGGLITRLEVKGAEGILAYQILSCTEKE